MTIKKLTKILMGIQGIGPKAVGANRNANGQPLTAEGTYEAQSPFPRGGPHVSRRHHPDPGPATVPGPGGCASAAAAAGKTQQYWQICHFLSS